MNLLTWDWQGGVEGSVPVDHYIASKHNSYFFEIKSVWEPPNDWLESFFTSSLLTKWWMEGYVIDDRWHAHNFRGKYDSLEEAMNAAEVDLLTVRLEGKI